MAWQDLSKKSPKPWRARVKHRGIVLDLGRYETKEMAEMMESAFKADAGIDNSPSAVALRGWKTKRFLRA